jgi:hypothetical protein
MRVSLFLLLAFQFVSCSKQKHFEKITYEGNIYDYLTSSPLEGYTLKLTACVPHTSKDQCDMFTVATVVTDKDGHFYIHERAARSGRYFIFINKTGSSKYLNAGWMGYETLTTKYSKIFL